MSHVITCPSGLTGRIRGMKVREERVLDDRKLAKSGGQVDALLVACWEETLEPGPYDFGDKDIDWGAMLQGDRFFALLQVRALTYGPTYAFVLGCQNEGCRARFEWELDLTELPCRHLSEESRVALLAGNRFETTLPDAGRRALPSPRAAPWGRGAGLGGGEEDCAGADLYSRLEGMVEPGSVILGKYRVERILGSGGMGVVALAHHLHLNEPMAVKFLQPNMLDKDEIVQRFLREAQAAVKLKGEHVCRVFDVGTLESGAPYMIMEYLHGVELGAYVREQGFLPLPVTVDIAMQACEALAEAHALGIVHRDVKPANFFLTQRTDGSPLVKLLDFGISKAINQVDADLTNTNATLGTPAYMSPEQLRSSKDVDTRTDIWALGIILYQLASGHRPFQAETFSALCLKVAMEPPPPLTVPLPPGFADIVMRCLEKDPGRRFQTVDELADALAPYHDATLSRPRRRSSRAVSAFSMTGPLAGDTGANAPSGHGVSMGTTLSGGAGHVMAGQGERPRTRRNPLWIAAAAAVLIAGGVAAMLLVDTGGDDRTEAASEAALAVPETGADEALAPGSAELAGEGIPGADGAGAGVGTEEAVAPVDDPGAAPEVAPPAPTTFTVESEPEGADVLEGGERVGTTPFEVELADGESRDYVIARSGYVEGAITLPDDAEDGRARVALQRKKPSGKKRPRKDDRLGEGDTLSW